MWHHLVSGGGWLTIRTNANSPSHGTLKRDLEIKHQRECQSGCLQGGMALDLDLDEISELADDRNRSFPGCTQLLVNSHPTHAQTSRRKNRFLLSSKLWFNDYSPVDRNCQGRRTKLLWQWRTAYCSAGGNGKPECGQEQMNLPHWVQLIEWMACVIYKLSPLKIQKFLSREGNEEWRKELR